jgi:hypothetical protein
MEGLRRQGKIQSPLTEAEDKRQRLKDAMDLARELYIRRKESKDDVVTQECINDAMSFYYAVDKFMEEKTQ